MRSATPTRFRDHYAILGVSPDASEAEIKAAYRERVKQCHPDLNPGDAAAAQRFQMITEARRVLLSPSARAAFNLDRIEHELRIEIVSVVNFRRPFGGGDAADPSAPRSVIRRPLWQGGSLLIVGILTILASLALLPFVSILGGPSAVSVTAFDSGALAGVLNSGACAILFVLAFAVVQGPMGRRWEALVGFTGTWLLAVSAASLDPHLLAGGFFSSDLGMAIGGRLLPIGIAVSLCGAWLLRPEKVPAS